MLHAGSCWRGVMVPMCSALGRIPWGNAHTGGHLKAYMDVAAIRDRTSTQGNNLFQGWDSSYVCVWVCVGVYARRDLWLYLDKVTVSQMRKTKHTLLWHFFFFLHKPWHWSEVLLLYAVVATFKSPKRLLFYLCYLMDKGQYISIRGPSENCQVWR